VVTLRRLLLSAPPVRFGDPVWHTMMRTMAAVVLVLAMLAQAAVTASLSSPIQKIVVMLDECKAKTQNDLEAEGKEMEKYTQFCDDEVNDKTYAIDNAARQLADLAATIEDATATIGSRTEETQTLGTDVAAKNGELYKATADRKDGKQVFVAAEKEMLASIDELNRAIETMQKGQNFLQSKSGKKTNLEDIVKAVSAVVDAEGVDSGSQNKLQNFLETAKKAAQGDEGDDETEVALNQQMLGQPQATTKAFESQGGGILETLGQMQEKAEGTLSDVRQKEMKDQHAFESVRQGINQEIAHANDKLATATADKAATIQILEDAKQKTGDTTAAKAADDEYRSTMKRECQAKALEWEQRLRSANGEIAAIGKAKEILQKGVKVFVQVRALTRRAHWDDVSSQDSADESVVRKRLGDALRELAQKHGSFALNQLATAAGSDPFGKVRGLVEKMIEKLMQEAQEAATKEAFCQEELGKSRKSQAEKQADADKHKTRMDSATTSIAELTQSIQTLTAEIAEIDRSQAEANELRKQENHEYKRASSDYRLSAEAVAQAVEVLKSYYEGAAFLQVQTAQKKARQPSFGGNQGDASHAIIGILEVAQEDFTQLLAETEGSESEASQAYDKLTQDNKVGRAAKSTEIRGKESEKKSLTTQLSHSTEDYESVMKELDTVTGYLSDMEKQCAIKVMSYAERKAAREAEIVGLKQALEILGGEGLAA